MVDGVAVAAEGDIGVAVAGMGVLAADVAVGVQVGGGVEPGGKIWKLSISSTAFNQSLPAKKALRAHNPGPLSIDLPNTTQLPFTTRHTSGVIEVTVACTPVLVVAKA